MPGAEARAASINQSSGLSLMPGGMWRALQRYTPVITGLGAWRLLSWSQAWSTFQANLGYMLKYLFNKKRLVDFATRSD